MAQIIDFAAERKARGELAEYPLSRFDHLECLRCGVVRPPVSVAPGPIVTYRCDGPGHRPYAWRIDEDGDILSGLKGRRRFRP